MNAKLAACLTVLAVLLAGCGGEPATSQPSATAIPQEKTVPSLSPAALRPGVTILAEGVLQAGHPVLRLSFETGGRLLAVYVQPGDRVQAGDMIATLDDTNAQEQVAQAQLSLEQAELEMRDLQSEAGQKMLSLERAELALEQAQVEAANAITRTLTRLEQAQEDLEGREAAWANDLTEARGALASAEAALETARLNLTVVQQSDVVAKNVRDREYEANWHEANYGEFLKKYERGEVDKTRLDLEYNNLLTAKERVEEARARAALALSEAQAGVTQAEDTLRQARARLVELEDQAAVTTARAALRQAELDYQEALENADASSPNMKLLALDVQRAQVSEAELAAGEIKVAQARLALESAQRGLEAVKLVAPTAGTVTAVETVTGAVVGGGTPVVALLDTAQLEFHTTNLSERDLAEISPGQAAVVTLKAYPDEPIEATVVRLGLQAGAAVGDAATFPVILAMSETGLDLRPGMTGRAEIRTEEP